MKSKWSSAGAALGSVKSPAKAKAARTNGALGGRPLKIGKFRAVVRRSSDRAALKRDLEARLPEISRVLSSPRNAGYEITTAHGTALLTE